MHQNNLIGTFVAFGNLERIFPRMADAVIAAYNLLPKPIVIQAGPNLTALRDLPGVKVFRSCSPTEFSNYVRSSTLLIIHGGLGAAKEAILSGRRPAIFVRSAKFGEHVDDHQADMCQILFKRDLAFHATDNSKLLEFVRQGDFFIQNYKTAVDFFDDSNLRAALHAQINLYVHR